MPMYLHSAVKQLSKIEILLCTCTCTDIEIKVSRAFFLVTSKWCLVEAQFHYAAADKKGFIFVFQTLLNNVPLHTYSVKLRGHNCNYKQHNSCIVEKLSKHHFMDTGHIAWIMQ